MSITEAMIVDVSRPDVPSGPGTNQEALVRFKLTSDRDTVMGSSAKLAGFSDNQGKPTAGIRLKVPPRLRTAFRVLFRYGQALRRRHGQGMRRHIKFDDTERNLFLNVKLPGDEKWSRVSLEVARRGLRARDLASDGDLERRLDIGGPLADGDRPRAMSLSTDNGNPPAARQSGPTPSGSSWTGRRSGSLAMD